MYIKASTYMDAHLIAFTNDFICYLMCIYFNQQQQHSATFSPNSELAK